jgi:protoheme IX farnesyltransferase
MKFRDDYAAAGVPMLPVVADAATVARQITWYSYAMVATSLLLVPIGNAGWLYLGSALVLGVMFLREAHLLQARVSRGDNPKPMRLFHWSITYLTILFVAIAVGQFTF